MYSCVAWRTFALFCSHYHCELYCWSKANPTRHCKHPSDCGLILMFQASPWWNPQGLVWKQPAYLEKKKNLIIMDSRKSQPNQRHPKPRNGKRWLKVQIEWNWKFLPMPFCGLVVKWCKMLDRAIFYQMLIMMNIQIWRFLAMIEKKNWHGKITWKAFRNVFCGTEVWTLH